jgi:transcription initiation factor IIE alpha subunit
MYKMSFETNAMEKRDGKVKEQNYFIQLNLCCYQFKFDLHTNSIPWEKSSL